MYVVTQLKSSIKGNPVHHPAILVRAPKQLGGHFILVIMKQGEFCLRLLALVSHYLHLIPTYHNHIYKYVTELYELLYIFLLQHVYLITAT
jgi:hypothetical protein